MSGIWKFQVTGHFERNNLNFEGKNGIVTLHDHGILKIK